MVFWYIAVVRRAICPKAFSHFNVVRLGAREALYFSSYEVFTFSNPYSISFVVIICLLFERIVQFVVNTEESLLRTWTFHVIPRIVYDFELNSEIVVGN